MNRLLETTYTLPIIFAVFQTGNRANGGVESITQVIERVQRIKPIVVTQFETPVNRRWCEAGAEVYVWPLSQRKDSSAWKSDLRTIIDTNYRLWQLVRSTGSRVVHCNDIQALWHTAFGARSAGAAVVQNIRGIKTADETYGWHWRVALHLSQCQVALSREMRAALFARLPLSGQLMQNGPSRIEYIYSAVDFGDMRPAEPTEHERLRRSLGIGPETFVLGCVAAFNPLKAQLAFIEQAGPLLKAMSANTHVYFIGDFEPTRDDYARACLEAVQRLKLEEMVHFVGYTTEVADWYRALDVVVVPSRREGLARCMIESLACGTPVVSFDVCSAREILEGYSCGLVVAQGDYSALVKHIADLAEQPTKRQALRQNGIRAARKLFDPESIVRAYEELYLSLAQGRSIAPI